jgi:hypothetical protein
MEPPTQTNVPTKSAVAESREFWAAAASALSIWLMTIQLDRPVAIKVPHRHRVATANTR